MILFTCDDLLPDWHTVAGTLSIDTDDKIEGIGSILWQIPVEAEASIIAVTIPAGEKRNLTNTKYYIYLKVDVATEPIQLRLNGYSGGNYCSYHYDIRCGEVGWNLIEVDLRNPTSYFKGSTMPPDLSNILEQNIIYENHNAARIVKLDLIEVKPLTATHTLTIESSPIIGMPVTLDGLPVGNTPISLIIIEGDHIVIVPSEVEI